MNTKSKITLNPEEETLLITLFAKAQAGNRLFFDPKAKEILDQVDYDFSSLKVPEKTVVLVCQRAKKIDAVTRTFLGEMDNVLVLHLGCGLDTRFWRLDDGKVIWYDLDMPEVIDLRQHFFSPNERYQTIATSVTDLGWVRKVKATGKAVIVVAEGLLMYLDESDVKKLVLRLREAFPGCRLIADVFSKLAARSATKHRSLQHTGASLGWGIDDPCEVETWGEGIRLIEEWYFSQDPGLGKLNLGYRLAYRLAGVFKMVRRAHRIVYYQL